MHGRTVVLVDDGLATGAAMVAAVRAARAAGAAFVVVAAPVASDEVVALVEAEADGLVILQVPPLLFAIGAWYGNFETLHTYLRRLQIQMDRAMLVGGNFGAGGGASRR